MDVKAGKPTSMVPLEVTIDAEDLKEIIADYANRNLRHHVKVKSKAPFSADHVEFHDHEMDGVLHHVTLRATAEALSDKEQVAGIDVAPAGGRMVPAEGDPDGIRLASEAKG
jgi:hypothetical protein